MKKRPAAHCRYCRRHLEPAGSSSQVAFTRDHVNPQSRGGGRWVPCCRACNHMKADMTPDEWDKFMSAVPEWWKYYPRTARSVITMTGVYRKDN